MQQEIRIVNVLGRLIPESGKIHQNQEVYLTFGGSIMCTVKATHYKDPPKVMYVLMWLIKMKKSRDIIRLIHRGSGDSKDGFIQ